jgi:uncharacterized protein
VISFGAKLLVSWLWIPGWRFTRPGMTAAIFVCFASLAAAYYFPVLTGRVVDEAGVINAATKTAIETKAKDLEDKSGIQLVVATVKSLQGGDIETFANDLFRFWKLGEAKKNNGVLLLVAPAEHKVRIEVGYGLEGTLTDALSSVIIQTAIIPRFKANDYSGGIERGVDGIISVLNGDSAEWQRKASVRSDDQSGTVFLFILYFAIVLFVIWYVARHSSGGPPGSGGGRFGGGPVFIPTSSWGGGSSDGGFGGGFSGGGGSSGGGGASGSW